MLTYLKNRNFVLQVDRRSLQLDFVPKSMRRQCFWKELGTARHSVRKTTCDKLAFLTARAKSLKPRLPSHSLVPMHYTRPPHIRAVGIIIWRRGSRNLVSHEPKEEGKLASVAHVATTRVVVVTHDELCVYDDDGAISFNSQHYNLILISF